MSSGMGWIPQKSSREMGSAGSVAFPCFFHSFLSPPWDAQGWLCLGVDPPGVLVSAEECRDSLSHHQGISSQDFQLLSPLIPSPQQPLTSSCCLLIFTLHLFPAPQPP